MSIIKPANFLDIVQRAAQRSQLASLPSTVSNQTGQALDFVLWAAEAWNELQTKREDWAFMLVRNPGVSFATQLNKVYYTPLEAGIAAGAVRYWVRNSFRIYPTSVGQVAEIELEWVDWETFRDVYQLGALRTSPVAPVVYTITPELHLGIQTPLAGYTVTGDYYRNPIQFENDSDVATGLPDWAYMALVYRTQMYYAASSNDATMYNEAEREYNTIVNRLGRIMLPEIRSGGALA